MPWCRTSLGGSADQGSPGLLHRGCWALQERHGAVSAWNTKMFVQLKPLSKSSFCGFLTHLGPHGIKLCLYFRAELSWAAPAQEAPAVCRDRTCTCLCTKGSATHPLHQSVSAARPELTQAQQGCLRIWQMKVRLREGSWILHRHNLVSQKCLPELSYHSSANRVAI